MMLNLNECLEQYDDLAEEIVMDRAHIVAGFGKTPYDMAVQATNLLDTSDLNLFEEYNYSEVYDRASAPEVLGTAMVAALKLTLFTEAMDRNVGQKAFNDWLIAYNQLWVNKLLELWHSLRVGSPVKHSWVN